MAAVLFAGGGIAGLTGAIALQRQGIEAHVYEAAAELHAVGAGIGVPPNAMAVLECLGLADAVLDAGIPLRRGDIVDVRAGTISTMDLDAVRARLGHTTVAIRRSELQRVLAGALEPGTLHLDRRIVSHQDEGDVVTACFDGGDSATGSLLIGADGIGSAVRGLLFPEARLRYSDQTCYRGLADIDLADELLHVAREIWGGALRFGFLTVAPGKVYWFAPMTAPPGQPQPERLKASLLRAYSAFPGPVLDILEASEEMAMIRTDLYDLAPLGTWHAGRVGLIGDAAHATTPNLGQGGGQAIEDGLSLAYGVATHGTVPAALRAFEHVRRRRATSIVSLSRTFARISHLRNPVARSLRNALLRAMPASAERRQLDSLFTPVV
jgi:2-polyprenyl-6-methoxyphenol hydroxylase-like FAD-dependent oxidoreductase